MPSLPTTRVLLSAALLGLAGCAGRKPAPLAAATVKAAAPVRLKGVGLEVADLRRSVSPCNDLVEFSGGNWLRANPVPSYASSWGPRNLVALRTQAMLKQVLEQAASRPAGPGSNAQQVGDFYAAAMDTAAIEAAGLRYLQPELDSIAALATRAGLPALLAHEQELGTEAFFRSNVEVDEQRPTRYVVTLKQGGLTLGNRDDYFNSDARTQRLREAYRTYMQQVFGLLGEDDATARRDAATVERLETQLARASRSRAPLYEARANNDLLPLPAAATRYPDLQLPGLLASRQLASAQEVVVGQPAFFEALNQLLRNEPLADLQTYLRWHLVHSAVATLPAAYVAADLRYHQALTGARQPAARWRRVQAATDATLGDAFGQLYMDQVLSPQARQQALALLADIRASLAEHLEASTLLSAPTKAEALKKLATMQVKIGHPDHWKDYSTLTIGRDSYTRNVLAARRWESRREVAHYGQRPTR